ncbi:Apolipoprotein N-acyltransferase / Copper homeostasis protein CutE [hydrothermal vent metagenome]|uniref:Apolipoprotein N-acyltransferase / Copper homeostasis protein CutE n=1 Tax=hydrothermal vent metagenome TaxID=652676 RepID=A0A3B1DMM0_9ZZZZ
MWILLSASLLVLSFPKFELSILAWVGLVPLFFALDGKTPGQAFRIAYFCGVLFFGATIWWFGHVTIAGAIAAILYLALYFGMFGIGYSLFAKYNFITKLFLLPSLWVALEFARSYLLSGFDWVSLSHSQYKNLIFIQIADISGVFGISFLVVMVNVFIKERFNHIPFTKWDVVPVCILLVVLGYGVFRLNGVQPSLSGMRVALVQANVPQHLKWNKIAWAGIIQKHLDLSEEAARENPDLIIWPETAFPGFIGEDDEYFSALQYFVKRINIPILFGAVVKEEGRYYNGALLLSPDGMIKQQYHKHHLVPFGEFIPFRTHFPFLSDIIPIADFSRGEGYTVFSSDTKKFSTLICFEDTLGRLARGFVNNGAQMLINITNDAWFEDTAAPWMHMQSAVFRTVENRRGLVRASNTGVSGFIDATGKIQYLLQNAQGKNTFVKGYAVGEVSFRKEKTFYTKFGDVFAYLCFACILGGVIGLNLRGTFSCPKNQLE